MSLNHTLGYLQTQKDEALLNYQRYYGMSKNEVRQIFGEPKEKLLNNPPQNGLSYGADELWIYGSLNSKLTSRNDFYFKENKLFKVEP